MPSNNNEVPKEETSRRVASVTSPTGKAAKKSNKTLFIILGVVVFLFVLLPVAAMIGLGIFVKNKVGTPENAAKTVESIVEKGSGTDVDLNTQDGNVSVKTKDGDSFSASTDNKIPDDFPKEVPLYQPSTVSGNLRSVTGGRTNWIVTLETDDEFEPITAFLKAKLNSDGWTTTSQSNDQEGGTFMAERTGLKLSVYYSHGDNSKHAIAYTVSQE